MKNLKELKKLVFQLFVFFNFDIFMIEPDFLTHNITTALYSFIVGFFAAFIYGVGSSSKFLSNFLALLLVC